MQLARILVHHVARALVGVLTHVDASTAGHQTQLALGHGIAAVCGPETVRVIVDLHGYLLRLAANPVLLLVLFPDGLRVNSTAADHQSKNIRSKFHELVILFLNLFTYNKLFLDYQINHLQNTF